MDKTRRPLELEITDITYGGAGVGKSGDKAVFVHGVFPGDKISATLFKSKKKWGEAELDNLLVPSALRRKSPCPYFDNCGGCPWMPLERKDQLAFKERILADQLKRIGGCEVKPAALHAPSPEFGYRARIQLHSSIHEGKPVIGFHARKTNLIIDIEKCLVANEAINEAIAALRNFVFDFPLLARLKAKYMIETGFPVNGIRITVSYRDEHPFQEIEKLFSYSRSIKGIVLINGTGTSLYRDTILQMNAGGLNLFYGTGAFSQINPEGNNILVEKVLEFAGKGRGEALDLYSGIGNFTFPLAKGGFAPVGVELSRDAVTYAKQNAETLGLGADFIAGEAYGSAAKLADEGRKFPLIVLDPPRIGAPGLGDIFRRLSAEKVVYVSCNPSSLARDTAELARHGFTLERVEMVDMFPQTFHLESVALFTRK
ncbi:MAG: 23S rRNA (uracil(1939)-C(5))-methyltransferase RlmD [Nitrospinota bacterium]|nr:23S rRNA (uracil(1939)-C(5))-methyltransferase RlmD [Nitrospinota bacterium]